MPLLSGHRVLVPKDDMETLDFPSSCESYERIVYYKDAATGKAKEAKCHSIASVVRLDDPGNLLHRIAAGS